MRYQRSYRYDSLADQVAAKRARLREKVERFPTPNIRAFKTAKVLEQVEVIIRKETSRSRAIGEAAEAIFQGLALAVMMVVITFLFYKTGQMLEYFVSK